MCKIVKRTSKSSAVKKQQDPKRVTKKSPITKKWETQKYQQFIFNPENSMNCNKCPANRNADSWPGYTLPCGQQCCWVDCAVCTDDVLSFIFMSLAPKLSSNLIYIYTIRRYIK